MFDPLHYYDMGKALVGRSPTFAGKNGSAQLGKGPARVQCGNIARGACREANTVQHDSQTLTLARETNSTRRSRVRY